MIPTSYYARSGLSACICFGPGLCLQVAIAFSCPIGALLALLYERGVVLFGRRSSLLLGRLNLRLDPSGLTKSAACAPLSLSTVTGRFPLSLISHLGLQFGVCSDRILTCRIKSIRSPAKVGLVVTDLITSPVVSWGGGRHPPPAPRLSCHSLLNHRRGKTSLLLW